MSNQTAQSAPTDSEEENQADQSNKQIDIDQQDNIQWGQFVQFLGMGGLGVYKKVGDTADAFKTFNDPKLTEALLDFKNPSRLTDIKYARSVIAGRLQKKKAKERGYTEFKLPWFNGRVTQDQLDRRSQAIIVADHVHGLVNTRETQIKIECTVRLYGFSPENAAEFRKSLDEWMGKNPGAKIDNYLLEESRKLYRKQYAQEGKSSDKQKQIEKQLSKDISKAKDQAIEELGKRGTIKRAEEVINEAILNPNNPQLTKEQLSDHINNYVVNGTPPKEGKLTEQKLAGGFIEIPSDLADEIMGYTPTTSKQPSAPQPQPATAPAPPARVVQQPIISKIPFKFTLPSFNPLSIFKPIPSGSLLGKLDNFLRVNTLNINRQIFGQIKNLGSTLKIGLGKIGSKIISKVGSKAIGAAIGQALGSLLPGIGNAAAALLSALGLDDLILRFAFQAALFAVLVVVGVFVFIIIGASSLFSTNTVDNPMIIPQSANSSGTSYNWQEFEEKYLSMINRQEVRPLDTWKEFEKTFLIGQKQFLTLDTDRHNQVQK